jgi:hypothetical protein
MPFHLFKCGMRSECNDNLTANAYAKLIQSTETGANSMIEPSAMVARKR